MSSISYVGLVAQPEVEQLRGAYAQKPFEAGQMIVGCGSWPDNTPTDYGIFLVLRQLDSKRYLMAPLGTKDVEWGKWLAEKANVKVMLWRKVTDNVPEDEELLRNWRIVSEKGEEPQKDDYAAFGSKIADGL